MYTVKICCYDYRPDYHYGIIIKTYLLKADEISHSFIYTDTQGIFDFIQKSKEDDKRMKLLNYPSTDQEKSDELLEKMGWGKDEAIGCIILELFDKSTEKVLKVLAFNSKAYVMENGKTIETIN